MSAERADVQNVAEQVMYLFGLEQDFKVARQQGIDKTIRRIEEKVHEREKDRNMSE